LHTKIFDIMPYNVYHIKVKYFDWDDDKNKWLMKNRNISFEMCMAIIEREETLAVEDNHPPYEHQKVYIIEVNNYCYRVPFVEDSEKIFLKTAYLSHEANKKYLNK